MNCAPRAHGGSTDGNGNGPDPHRQMRQTAPVAERAYNSAVWDDELVRAPDTGDTRVDRWQARARRRAQLARDLARALRERHVHAGVVPFMMMNYVGFIVGLLLSAIGIYVHAKMQQAYFDHGGDDRRPDDAAEIVIPPAAVELLGGWLTPAQLRLVQKARAAGSLSTREVYEAGLTERGIIDALLSEVIARRRDAADDVRKYHPRGEPCPPQSTP